MARSGIKGQWIMEIEDWTTDEVMHFYSCEDSGLELPHAQLIIKSKDQDKVAEYTKPGKKLKTMLYKEDTGDFISGEWEVQKKEGADGPGGGGNWGMKIWLYLDHTSYLNTPHFESYDNGGAGFKSSEVFEKVTQQDKLIPDTKTTNDKMVWIQYGITNRQLLEYLTFYGWYAANDPVFTAIYQNGSYLYLPLSELKNRKRGTIGNSKNCNYKANTLNFIQDDGFFSNAIGESRNVGQHSSEHGVDFRDLTKAGSYVTGTAFKQGTSRNSVFEHLSDNVHRNWWPAVNQNRQGRAGISAFTTSFALHTIYDDLKPLNFVKVDWRNQNDENKAVNKAYSGDWMVITSEYYIDFQLGTAYQTVTIGRDKLAE